MKVIFRVEAEHEPDDRGHLRREAVFEIEALVTEFVANLLITSVSAHLADAHRPGGAVVRTVD